MSFDRTGNIRMTASLILVMVCILLQSCSRLTTQDVDNDGTSSLRILFLGNSHTAFHNVPGLVKTLIDSTGKHEQAVVDTATGAFLKDLAGDKSIEKTIRTGKWDYVVMQGQEISMSGRFIYSTGEAESLSSMANKAGAKVIWFAEWGRLGVEGETERIENIYKQISSVNKDVVSPVGRVWQNVQAKQNDLELHSPDGNHANALGASLAALTLYSSITRSDCRELPTIDSSEFGEDVQTFLKSVVWETLDADAKGGAGSEKTIGDKGDEEEKASSVNPRQNNSS